MRECLSCHASGKECSYCGGKGFVPAPDIEALTLAVTNKRGGSLRLRQSPPNGNRLYFKGAREYFVWRLARFHGGADVTMPVMAETYIRHDPYQEELDAIASALARTFFGTDMAAAFRWGMAFGWVKPDQVPDGLPESAYPGGCVVPAGDKPEDEYLKYGE